MFMKTIAVGPLAPADVCGLTEALLLLHREIEGRTIDVAGLIETARLAAHVQGARKAIV